MASGKVLRFDGVRGYGFIAPDDGGEDVFVHANDFAGDKSMLTPGARVEFEIEEGGRGLKAYAVRIVAATSSPPARVAVHRGSGDGGTGDGGDEQVLYDVLTYADFKLEITEALLHGVPSLTGTQLLQARERILELVRSHNWVDA